MENEVVKTGMETIIAGISNVTTVVGNVFGVMTGNPYLVFLLAASCVGVGISVFRRVKGASRG